MEGAFQQGWRIFHEQAGEAPVEKKTEMQMLGKRSVGGKQHN